MRGGRGVAAGLRLGSAREDMVRSARLLPQFGLSVATPATAPDARRRVALGRNAATGRTSCTMSLLLNLILSAGFAAAFGAAVHFWRIHLDTSRRDEMQALAARRGWALTVTGERLGRAGTLRLVPRGGLPWVAEARPGGSAGGPVTEYEAEAPRWAEGTLILVAGPLPETEAEGFPSLRGLRDLLGEKTARLAGSLRVVPGPEGVTVLSDGSPSRRADLGDLAATLRAWPPLAQGSRGLPVVILSPEGLRLRLRTTIKRPEQMERFLDLALGLSRLIGP